MSWWLECMSPNGDAWEVLLFASLWTIQLSVKGATR